MHSISSYVQRMIRRDFVGKHHLPGSAGQASLVEVVIPSFTEDECPVDEYPATALARYTKLLPKQPFILFVGALRQVKGLAQLLEAYERLVDPPTLVLIGTIEADTPQVFPRGVVVLQDFPHRAVMAAWERCLFGVVPSLWPEPLGSVVYEAMSKGKAVIGTTPGGHTDMIVDHETGLLVPVGDVDALTSAMRQLIDDPELRERLGRAAREPAKLFTAGVAVPRFEQTYWQLVEQSRPVNERSSLPLRQR
ncbi:MAG TPA: glycosyltransferase family 4 protein [Roseiflexaceae bacterium]|nr:glycosyltransferase family 4 protein [Roseiflexaceae bacterium]